MIGGKFADNLSFWKGLRRLKLLESRGNIEWMRKYQKFFSYFLGKQCFVNVMEIGNEQNEF